MKDAIEGVGNSGWGSANVTVTVQRWTVAGAMVAGAMMACVMGCGGAGRPAGAETPSEGEPTGGSYAPAEEVAPEQVEETMPETQGASEDSGGAEAASSEDLQQAIQVVVQDEALLSELKLGEPGRFPLKIAGSSLPTGLQIQAHSEAVQVVVAPADPKTEPVLIFTDVTLNARQGTFKYRYDVEGVRGTSHVVKNAAGVWELKSSRVSEY